MLDKEDLQAMAQLMDTQLDGKLKPIAERLDHMQGDISILKADVDTLKAGVGTLKADVGTLKAGVGTLKTDVGTLKTDVDALKEDSAITRNGVNNLLDWADDASIQIVPLFNRKKPE